jgi:hypothetical protein
VISWCDKKGRQEMAKFTRYVLVFFSPFVSFDSLVVHRETDDVPTASSLAAAMVLQYLTTWHVSPASSSAPGL